MKWDAIVWSLESMLSLDQIEVIKEQAYAGVSSSLGNICKVYPNKMIEIIEMGSNVYNKRLGLLLLNEVDIAKIIKDKTKQEPKIEEIYPLSYLLQSADNDDMFLLELQLAFSTFIKEDILLLPKINSVLVGSPKNRRLITNENFADFQDILRVQNRRKIKEPPPPNESAIARKFRLKGELRDAIKKQQQAKNNEEQSLAELLEIAETFGIDYKNKTFYAFYGLLTRHRLREAWNQYIQMLCAGAESKKIKTEYWGGSLKEK